MYGLFATQPKYTKNKFVSVRIPKQTAFDLTSAPGQFDGVGQAPWSDTIYSWQV